MSWITSFTDTLNGLNPIFQWAIGLGCTFAIFFGMRYVMKTYILDIVKRTSFDWDDKLYSPVSTRLYTFIFVAGLKITMTWVMGETSSFVLSINPFFEAIFILLSTSLISVSLRVMVPVAMSKFSDSSVTVSGSNSLIIFVGRAAVWFGGAYLALSELGIELLGLLASLAVFSLIIGLAMQQTLGNIINSFMLALD